MIVTTSHPLNTNTEPRPSRTLELVEASKRRHILHSKAVEAVVQPRPVSLLLVKRSSSSMGPPKLKPNNFTD